MHLEMRGVSKSFQAHSGLIQALDRIDLSLEHGEFVSLLGPSGCGKSTLLNLLAGLEAPTQGEIYVDDKLVTDTDSSRVLIFQNAALFPWLSVQGNIEFGLKMKNASRSVVRDTTQRLLRMVHLEKFSHSLVHELSGGMKQRVALARALAVEPAILLLDEPFGALDALTRDRLHLELQEIWARSKKTIVFVTHNVREAVALGDRVLVLSPRPGRLVAEHVIDLPRPRQVSDVALAEFATRITADLQLEEN